MSYAVFLFLSKEIASREALRKLQHISLVASLPRAHRLPPCSATHNTLGSHPLRTHYPQQGSTAAPVPHFMLQCKSPNWSPGYIWIKLITKQDIHGNSQAVPLKAQARSRSSQQLWLRPDSSLCSCWESEHTLSNMSAKTTLVMLISALFMMVKLLGSKPNVKIGGFIK